MHREGSDDSVLRLDLADTAMDGRDPPAKDVVVANEARHEFALGLLIENLRFCDLLNSAAMEHGHSR